MITVELVQGTITPELYIEKAYKVCYDSPTVQSDEERGEFITSKIKQGHLSPLEFAFAQFCITCSRATSHQLVRHRIASYAQESQRRVDVEPVRIWPETFNQLEDFEKDSLRTFLEVSYEWYLMLIRAGVPKEDARYVLPSCYQTRIMVGMNFRALRHFFKLRCSKHAQWEIRIIAKEMLRLIHPYATSVFGDLLEKYIDPLDMFEDEDKAELWTEWD